VLCYDPFTDKDEAPKFEKSVFFIGTRHDVFATWEFPEGSVVIDPHRYIPDQLGVKIIRIGQEK